jgi:hypothetical protein
LSKNANVEGFYRYLKTTKSNNCRGRSRSGVLSKNGSSYGAMDCFMEERPLPHRGRIFFMCPGDGERPARYRKIFLTKREREECLENMRIQGRTEQ